MHLANIDQKGGMSGGSSGTGSSAVWFATMSPSRWGKKDTLVGTAKLSTPALA